MHTDEKKAPLNLQNLVLVIVIYLLFYDQDFCIIQKHLSCIFTKNMYKHNPHSPPMYRKASPQIAM